MQENCFKFRLRTLVW